eukprot:5454290-Prorocentrum_lima.AAC.1
MEPRVKTELQTNTETRARLGHHVKVEQLPGSLPRGRQMHLTTPAPTSRPTATNNGPAKPSSSLTAGSGPKQ